MKDYFEVKDKIANVFDETDLLGFYAIYIVSKKTNKVIEQYKIKSIAGVKSFTALMRACKDPANQFCPHSVSCESTHSQDGGNPPPPPVSSNPTTAGGNLLFAITIKNNSVKYVRSCGAVLAVVQYLGDKYTYHLPFDSYYKIKRIHDDCVALHGYPISIKRHLSLCRSLSYDCKNERYAVA